MLISASLDASFWSLWTITLLSSIRTSIPLILPCVKCLLIGSNSTGWRFLGSTSSGSSYLVWIGSSVTKSLSLTNTSCKILSSMNLYGFNLLPLWSTGLGSNLSIVTSRTILWVDNIGSYMVQTIVFEFLMHVWKQLLETKICTLQIETLFQWTYYVTIMICSTS